MGVGGVKFSGKKRYEGVRFNVISVTRGWVQFPGKKRYVTLEWPLMDAVRKSMAVVEVTEEDAEDRTKWRWNICCGDQKKKNNKQIYLYYMPQDRYNDRDRN